MANTFNLGNGSWAQKTEKLLAYNAENDNYKPLPFDFDRGSTATRVNKQGLIEKVGVDEPRIDFLNNTKGHLLLEPSRQNEVTNSVDLLEYFNNTTTVTETSNATTSPDGSVSAYKYEGDGSSTSIRLFENRSFSENTTYSLSVFAKAGTNNFLQLGILGVGGSRTVFFDLSTATASSEFGKIENYGNGWYRCSITADVATGDLSGNANIYITKSLSETGFDSNSDAQNATMFLWGAQLEEGSYATSYIPTQGSAVTRSAENCNDAGNSTVFNDSEGVLYLDISALGTDSTIRQIAIGNSTNNVKFLYNSSSTAHRAIVKVSGINAFDFTYTVSDIDFHKVAIKYKQNDFALWVNGVERGTDTNGSTPIGLSEIAFDDGSGGSDFYGKVKDLRVYNTTLTDAELIQLTS